MEHIDALTLFNVGKLLYKLAFFAGVIKFSLIKWLTPENCESFQADRFCTCKYKNLTNYKKKTGQANT